MNPDPKILIGDNTEANVALLRATLADAGYSNMDATTRSSEVLDLCADREPDILLLDLHMPDPDGFEILSRLDREGPGWFPVLVLTADTTSDARERALAAGATDFLSKPFDRVEMLQRTANMLQLRAQHRRLSDQTVALEAAVAERTAELEDSRIDALRRLALAGEFRDDDTGRHTEHVGHIAALIATQLKLPRAEVSLIRLAAQLHDIGKIGIPDSILLKPGRLSPEEFTVMKEHTTIGAKILAGSSSPLLQMAESIAIAHHERWDGGGYPRGTRAEEIALEARITAVADVFDALTRDRPYRTAWSFDRAIEEIDAGRDTQFDPRVVTAFSHAIPEIMRNLQTTHGETAGSRR